MAQLVVSMYLEGSRLYHDSIFLFGLLHDNPVGSNESYLTHADYNIFSNSPKREEIASSLNHANKASEQNMLNKEFPLYLQKYPATCYHRYENLK
jgi:hypothetical protein